MKLYREGMSSWPPRRLGLRPGDLSRHRALGAESGWDFSSRWFADARTLAAIDTTEIIPVDLNALMFGLENAIRAGCEWDGDHDCAEDFAKRAAARRSAIDRYLWDPSRGAYLDYRWTKKQPIDHITAATLYPLFTHVANETQAASVAKAVEAELLKPGGIVATTLDTDSMDGQTDGLRCSGSRSKV